MLKYEIISHVDELPLFFNYYKQTTELIPSHWHRHIEVIYITNGSMDVMINGTTYKLYAKDMFLINSSCIHLTKTNEPTDVVLLQIPYEIFENSIKDMDCIHFKSYYPFFELSSTDSFIQLSACLLDMLAIYKKKEIGYPFLFNSKLHQFLYHLYTNYSVKNSMVKFPTTEKNRIHLQKAIDYMSQHYQERITLSGISKHLALNSEYFCRIFKKNMGFTFLEYLNQIRLTYIYQDIIHTNDSIMEIQERHGFSNYKVLNRMFKEAYGCTPSQARKNRKA